MTYEEFKMFRLCEALETIKDTCAGRKHCSMCPLGDSDGCILMRDEAPCRWDIHEPDEHGRVIGW
jgi:hypothetical protein